MQQTTRELELQVSTLQKRNQAVLSNAQAASAPSPAMNGTEQASSPVAQNSPLQEGRSVAECSGLAGHPADQDNRTGKWQADMAGLDPSGVERAVVACRTALENSRDEPLKRQITAQLGRAFLASAVRKKRDAHEDAGAKQDMRLGLTALNDARKLGSAYASSLLGSYYNGVLDNEAGPGLLKNFFVERQPSKAAEFFDEAAKRGSPIGMTLLAALMLNKDDASPEQKKTLSTGTQKQILSLLERAEAMEYSKAFLIHGGAYLEPRMFTGTSTEERRRKAAAIAEKAACFGASAEADMFFEKNKLTPYRSPQPSCVNELKPARSRQDASGAARRPI